MPLPRGLPAAGVEPLSMLSPHQLSCGPQQPFFLKKTKTKTKNFSQTFYLFVLFGFVSLCAYTTQKLLLCFCHWISETNPGHWAWWQSLYRLSHLASLPESHTEVMQPLAKGLSDVHQVTL